MTGVAYRTMPQGQRAAKTREWIAVRDAVNVVGGIEQSTKPNKPRAIRHAKAKGASSKPVAAKRGTPLMHRACGGQHDGAR